MDDRPDWEIRDRDGATEVRLRGSWSLLAVTADNGSLSERLQRLAGIPGVIPWRSLSATIYEAGVRSLPLLALIGILTGMVLAYEMSGQLKQFGVNRAIIGIVGLAFLRQPDSRPVGVEPNGHRSVNRIGCRSEDARSE
jgi:hypothetical protein